MLTVNNLSADIGDLHLFENLTFAINAGDRIGIVGPNGASKTTLLRILCGDLRSTSGVVSYSPGVRVGYLRQGFADVPDGTLGDLIDGLTQGLLRAAEEIEEASGMLAEPDADHDASGERYDRALDRFESLGGYILQAEVDATLSRFGLTTVPYETRLDELSGGQKTRAGLATLLATRPDVLLLDEPTNHLDAEAMSWLSTWLQAFEGALGVVSHDRAFLDDVVTEILELSPQTRTGRAYTGNYSEFAAAREHEATEAESAWKRQVEKVERINRDIRAAEAKSRSIESSTIDFAVRKKAAKIARPAVVRKAKLERLLESEDAAERPERQWGMALTFADADDGARDIIELADVGFAYGDRVVLEHVDLLVRRRDRLALIGPNGAGKTTLLRIIAGELTPTSGEIRREPSLKAGYFSQEQRTLDANLTVLEQCKRRVAMSDTDIRNELHKFLFAGDDVHARIGDLSYGERARLMLALLVLEGTTLLLIDEPLNHLDIQARENFSRALAAFGGTIVMVLHDRYAIEQIANRIVAVGDGQVQDVKWNA